MGSCLRCYIKTVPGERVETELTLPEPAGAVIAGRVRRSSGEPAPGAVVLAVDCQSGDPLFHCTADCDGIFVLGPLPAKLYDLHVYDGGTPVRVVHVAG